MNLQLWLRNKARKLVDRPFCSTSSLVQRIGDEGSGWTIHTSPMPSVCYCAGVGKGMSFEQELARRIGRPILVLDPSPTGIATIENSATVNLDFHPVGLAAKSGRIQFSLPLDPDEGSYSVARDGLDVVAFECWDVPTIMKMNGDLWIDLLKMDIEGFEYDILDDLLARKISIRQICVEFHPWLTSPRRTLKVKWVLYRAGYRIIHKHRGDHTFILSERSF